MAQWNRAQKNLLLENFKHPNVEAENIAKSSSVAFTKDASSGNSTPKKETHFSKIASLKLQYGATSNSVRKRSFHKLPPKNLAELNWGMHRNFAPEKCANHKKSTFSKWASSSNTAFAKEQSCWNMTHQKSAIPRNLAPENEVGSSK